MKLKVPMPSRIEALIIQAETFSKHLRKRLNPLLSVDKRLTVHQLQTLNAEALDYCLVTPEIFRLQTQLQNSLEWL